MLHKRMNLVGLVLVVACGSALAACGETDTGEPYSAPLVYCDNPDAAAVSCTLPGYTLDDDSGLRDKLATCATAGCHGMGAISATTWVIDLSGSVEESLSGLVTYGGAGYFLVDDSDPDCSHMLAEVTGKPIGVRMPNTGNSADYWTSAEADCFRSYLHELYPPQ